ncbi:unnamed protein product [Prorocentrum cordatum]|uniref:Uncharacterized protein n=1 Tax=Prorocentrum cordatum TaxID=2364126 RepID=A0ABN9TUJ7_9DINO|nr:unnamed protein product [Polarella glacialis]
MPGSDRRRQGGSPTGLPREGWPPGGGFAATACRQAAPRARAASGASWRWRPVAAARLVRAVPPSQSLPRSIGPGKSLDDASSGRGSSERGVKTFARTGPS